MTVAQFFKRCAGCTSYLHRKRVSIAKPCMESVSVTKIGNGDSARVVCVQGDTKGSRQLAAMGIVPGAVITKKGSSPLKGPVVLKKGSTEFAIGYSIALRLLVDKIEK